MNDRLEDGREDKDLVRPYVVDGIEEYDNPMPPWWVAMFKITIVFGLIYMIWVHWFGWSQLEMELTEEQNIHAELQKKLAANGNGGADFAQRSSSPELIATGKPLFVANCAPCHGNAGEGVVGPNLTDKFWLHGGSPEAIVKVISKGVPDKGMIAWGAILGPSKIEAVSAYVLSLGGSNPPNAKAAQGKEAE